MIINRERVSNYNVKQVEFPKLKEVVKEKPVEKLDYTLLSFPALAELVKVRSLGKYERDSYKTHPKDDLERKLLRHVFEYFNGQVINNEDGGVYTLAQVMCHCMFLIERELLSK